MDLKSLANSYTTPDGAITFWMIPFRLVACDNELNALDTIDPQRHYINLKTREVLTEEPADHRKTRLAYEGMNKDVKGAKPFKSDRWRIEFTWTGLHTCFWNCVPLTVEIEFHTELKPLSAEWRTLQLYWNEYREKPIAERWAFFKAMIGTTVYNEWWAAHAATRDVPMPAPKELGEQDPGEDADPQAESVGAASTADTSNS